ncbi:MAG: type VI secretion system protein TssA [Pseudomonadota bacterium]
MFSSDQLLVPISAARPGGEDLAFSSELDAIAQARRFDDPSLDQGEWLTQLKEADWDLVARRCTELLASKSKDLRLAVWLTEAAAKLHHLRGLGEGFSLIAGLLDQYWDSGLYPISEANEHEQRIGNLSWILGRVHALTREMALTEGRGTSYSSVDFDVARKRAASLIPAALAPGAATLADMEAARRANSPQFCASFLHDARFCLDALITLEQAADARLGADSPSFSSARDALQAMLYALPDAAKVPAKAALAAPAAAALALAPVQPNASGGPIATREQAIAQLRQVSQFFRRSEPHSPASYFADKAADAAEQSLHTWLRSVLKDGASLAHIEEMLGVPSGAS